jgi:hypothetical protein
MPIPVTTASQPRAILDLLPNLVDGFAANLIAYATLLAAIATLTMALLELLKAVLQLRPQYHRRMVRRWLASEACYEELLILSVAGVDSANALFDQPTGKMMGQLQAATNVVVEFPAMFPAMYDFLTRVPRSEAAAAETTGRGVAAAGTSDAQVWRAFVAQLESPAPAPGAARSPLSAASADEPDPAVVRAATHARTRIDHFISRKLDAFQTRTEYLWARANQTAAVAGAAGVIVYLLQSQSVATSWLQQVTLAAFGGMVAPFAKDVVSALTGLKTRP